MATENIEIECKWYLMNADELLVALHRDAKFKYERHQIDEYYNPPHRNFLDQLKTDGAVDEWFRLRIESDRASVNYKHWHRANGETMYCDEFETIVESPDTMRRILELTGFRPIATVDKVRFAFEMGDFEIAVDREKTLGDFIEIEYCGDLNGRDNMAILDEIKNMAYHIGAKLGDRDQRGFPFIIMDRAGLLNY